VTTRPLCADVKVASVTGDRFAVSRYRRRRATLRPVASHGWPAPAITAWFSVSGQGTPLTAGLLVAAGRSLPFALILPSAFEGVRAGGFLGVRHAWAADTTTGRPNARRVICRQLRTRRLSRGGTALAGPVAAAVAGGGDGHRDRFDGVTRRCGRRPIGVGPDQGAAAEHR